MANMCVYNLTLVPGHLAGRIYITHSNFHYFSWKGFVIGFLPTSFFLFHTYPRGVKYCCITATFEDIKAGCGLQIYLCRHFCHLFPYIRLCRFILISFFFLMHTKKRECAGTAPLNYAKILISLTILHAHL